MLFIDGQNFHDINIFKKIKTHLNKKNNFIFSKIYANEDSIWVSEHKNLKLEIKKFNRNSFITNADISIAFDIGKFSNSNSFIDWIILLSNDGDFANLHSLLKENSIKFMIISNNEKLRKFCDSFLLIDKFSNNKEKKYEDKIIKFTKEFIYFCVDNFTSNLGGLGQKIKQNFGFNNPVAKIKLFDDIFVFKRNEIFYNTSLANHNYKDELIKTALKIFYDLNKNEISTRSLGQRIFNKIYIESPINKLREIDIFKFKTNNLISIDYNKLAKFYVDNCYINLENKVLENIKNNKNLDKDIMELYKKYLK